MYGINNVRVEASQKFKFATTWTSNKFYKKLENEKMKKWKNEKMKIWKYENMKIWKNKDVWYTYIIE